MAFTGRALTGRSRTPASPPTSAKSVIEETSFSASILVSWAIALLEYCLAVPANRLGYGEFSGFQLKIIQEVITLVVFMAFAVLFLREKLAWNYLVAFGFLGMAAFFAFAFKAPVPTS